MRWWPLLMIAGCVPISVDDYAGGSAPREDGGQPGGELREDASAPSLDASRMEPATDATVTDATPAEGLADAQVPPPPRVDASVEQDTDAGVLPVDAGVTVDAGAVDAAVDASTPDATVIGCDTEYVVCDDFETGPMCPTRPGPNWTECERIADPTGPVREQLAGGSWALRSRVSQTAGSRSQRILRTIPLDADYFEADFWMITDPSSSEWFTFLKLQQEAGADADGEPTNYPGISLIGRSGMMGVAIETMESLDKSYYLELDLGPWPTDWIHVNFAVELKKLDVTVTFEQYEPSKGWQGLSYPVGKVDIRRQYFALGVYAESEGAVQMLFDDVRIHAAKNGKLIPLP
ncbi:MAG: hypothetical protein ABW352_14485 [Polyangiales bacterium]